MWSARKEVQRNRLGERTSSPSIFQSLNGQKFEPWSVCTPNILFLSKTKNHTTLSSSLRKFWVFFKSTFYDTLKQQKIPPPFWYMAAFWRRLAIVAHEMNLDWNSTKNSKKTFKDNYRKDFIWNYILLGNILCCKLRHSVSTIMSFSTFFRLLKDVAMYQDRGIFTF